MSEYISSDDVRELISRLNNTSCDFEKDRIKSKLDSIADEHRFGDRKIDCDSGVDSDEIQSKLSGYGSHNFYEYMYGD
nr:hypothetical protein [Candidatus Woesearchaeota archaeon]